MGENNEQSGKNKVISVNIQDIDLSAKITSAKQPNLNIRPLSNFNSMEGFINPKPAYKITQSNAIKDIRPSPKSEPRPTSQTPKIPTVAKPVVTREPEVVALEPEMILANEPDDEQTSEAIDDIAITYNDDLLSQKRLQEDQAEEQRKKNNKKFSIAKIFKNKWFYFSLGLLLITIFAIPNTRYLILGKFIQNQYSFIVEDSATSQPVGGALITVNNQNLKTNSSGVAKIVLSLGKYNYKINKQYYVNKSGSIFVGLISNKSKPIKLLATGRQVTIKVINKISGMPIGGVVVNVLSGATTTNSSGIASVVLPTEANAYQAAFSLPSYNTVVTNISVTSNPNTNLIKMVPIGKVYCLNNSYGAVNVVSSNLDGSNQQIIVKGTGQESLSNSKLLSSPDWKYLILETSRGVGQPALYLINTSTNKLTQIDGSNNIYKLIGWNKDLFVYDSLNSSLPTNSASREQIKSYNASTMQLNQLDSNLVNTSGSSFAYQSFYNFDLLPNYLLYNTQWNSPSSFDLSTVSGTIRGIEPSGNNKKEYQSFASNTTGTIVAARYQVSSVYYSVPNTVLNQSAFYNYSDGGVSNDATINASNFSQTYPEYYLSPSGEQSLWTNGQGTYLGDQIGLNQKTLKVPTGYSAYGWFDNVYILLSKQNQLYIVTPDGSQNPVLIGSYI